MRGAVRPTRLMPISDAVQKEFQKFAAIRVLSEAELFGGKICAALGRGDSLTKVREKWWIFENWSAAYIKYVSTGSGESCHFYPASLNCHHVLDRQHPRDLFDVRYMLDNEGLTEEIKDGFIIALLSHNRPLHEMLNPNFLN